MAANINLHFPINEPAHSQKLHEPVTSRREGGLLRNDVYLGVYRFRKTVQNKDSDGTYFQLLRKDHIVVGSREKPNHPPLIDKATLDLAQQKVQANRKKTGQLAMATGLLRCPGCGLPMHVRFSTKSRKTCPNGRVPKYICATRPHCPSKRLSPKPTTRCGQLWSSC